jgi:pimeloyl-ACP methyl ester carboxylesterase
VTVDDRTLVLLPGFLSSPRAYDALVAPLAATGVQVEVPSLAPGRLALLSGRYAVEQEGVDAAALVRRLVERGRRVVLAGHSRGGQAALRAARILVPDDDVRRHLLGLVLVDPVDGGGRQPSARTTTAWRTSLGVPTTVVGAGQGGACAPEPVNHVAFADAVPDARHVVVEGLGHADMLDGAERTLGRRLCGGADDPDPGSALVGRLLLAALDGCDPAAIDDPLLRVVR